MGQGVGVVVERVRAGVGEGDGEHGLEKQGRGRTSLATVCTWSRTFER